jgi:DNA-directed RNA polymerase specialized sigma subunit
MVANFSKEELTTPKATVLRVAEENTEELVNKINAEHKPKSDLVNDQRRKKRNNLLYRKLLLAKIDHLSEEEKQVIESVLEKSQTTSRAPT